MKPRSGVQCDANAEAGDRGGARIPSVDASTRMSIPECELHMQTAE